MGNWDATSFGNDDAADFADALSEGRLEWSAVENILVLAASVPVAEIHIQDARVVVAAAELVAAAMGRPPAAATPYGNDVIVLAGAHTDLARLHIPASTALKRVLEPISALQRYWDTQDEPEYRDEWKCMIADLQGRLSTPNRPGAPNSSR